MSNKRTALLQKYIPLLCGILTSVIVLMLMNHDFPKVGHDYRYFTVHMEDTKLSMLINGLVIQWYTPTFGGGLPAYANPQQIQYSIVQLLNLWMNAWIAILLSTFAVTLIGFMAFYRFLSIVMKFHWTSSTLGAIFFIGNGFLIEHMIAGHLGDQLIPLGSVILLEATNDEHPLLKSGGIIALVLAMMIHQAGFYIIVILGLSLAMLLPLIYLFRHSVFSVPMLLRKFALGLAFAGFVASSKISAVMAFMKLFPRVVHDFYPVGIAQAFIGLIAQLLGSMFLVPFLILAHQDISFLSGAFANITGAHYGIWETDNGLSPVLILLLFSSLLQGIRSLRTRKFHGLAHKWVWLILLFSIWLTIEMTFAKGLLYSVIKNLPVLRSMHVNVRFSAAFTLPLILVGIAEYERLTQSRSREKFFVPVTGIALLFLFLYNLFPGDVFSREYDLGKIIETDSEMARGDRFVIDHVAAIDDESTFMQHATNILFYEPLLSDYDPQKGYIPSKDFVAQIHEGAVTETDHGYYNMANPSSLLFPKENQVKPFDRIKVGEETELQAFVQRKQPDWKISTTQGMLNWISLISFLLVMSLAVFPLRSRKPSTAENKT